jgi:hypothetical protein
MLPTTKLEALNEMLTCVGEAPVNSMTTGYIQAQIAEGILDATTREVQSRGWNFNTEVDWTINPDLDGNLKLPANVLKVDGVTQSAEFNWVMKDGKMYNKVSHSFISTSALKVNMVLLLEFQSLPEAAKRYITLRASRILQDRKTGLPNLHQFNLQDEHTALIELRDMDMDTNDFSIFDSFDTYQIINRTGGRVR